MTDRTYPAWLQVLLVAIPKGLGGVLTIGINALLLKYLGPTDFGIFAICILMVAWADGVLGSAIDLTVVKLATQHYPNDPAQAQMVEQVGLLLKVSLLGLLMALVLLVGNATSMQLFHRPDPGLLALAVGNACLVLLLRSAFLNFQLHHQFIRYAVAESLAQSFRLGGVLAVVLWWSPTPFALMVGSLLGTLLALACGAWLSQRIWKNMTTGGWGRLKSRCKEFISHLRLVLMTFAFSAFLTRLDVLLLTQFSSMQQVGLFAAGQVFSQIPELLGSYIAVVFSSRVAPAAQNGTLPRLMRRVQSVLWALALFMAACATGAWYVADQWLPASYQSYASSGTITLLLLAGTLSAMCAFPLVIPYVMFSRPTFIFKLDLLTLPLVLVAYYFAIERAGGLGAAWVTGGTRLLKLLILQTLAWHWASKEAQDLPTRT